MSLVLSNHGGHASGLGGRVLEYIGHVAATSVLVSRTKTSNTISIGTADATRDIIVIAQSYDTNSSNLTTSYAPSITSATINGAPMTIAAHNVVSVTEFILFPFPLPAAIVTFASVLHARVPEGTDAEVVLEFSGSGDLGVAGMRFAFFKATGKGRPLEVVDTMMAARSLASNSPLEGSITAPRGGFLVAGSAVNASGWALTHGVDNAIVYSAYYTNGYVSQVASPGARMVRLDRVSGENSMAGALTAVSFR